jgi:hypothetical protein
MNRYRDMPRNVHRYLWLILASFAVSIVSLPWQPRDPKTQVELGIGDIGYTELTFVFGLLVFFVFAPFIWAAAWRRKNWARWVLLISFLVALPFMLDVPSGFYSLRPFATACTDISLVMEAMALYFLFSGDAKPWFRKANSGPRLPTA